MSGLSEGEWPVVEVDGHIEGSLPDPLSVASDPPIVDVDQPGTPPKVDSREVDTPPGSPPDGETTHTHEGELLSSNQQTAAFTGEYMMWFVTPSHNVVHNTQGPPTQNMNDGDQGRESAPLVSVRMARDANFNLMAAATFFALIFAGTAAWALWRDGWAGTEKFAALGLLSFLPLAFTSGYHVLWAADENGWGSVVYAASFLLLVGVWAVVAPGFVVAWALERHESGVLAAILALRLGAGFIVLSVLFCTLVPFVWQSITVVREYKGHRVDGCLMGCAAWTGTTILRGRRCISGAGTHCRPFGWCDCGDCDWNCHRILCRRDGFDEETGNCFQGKELPCCDPMNDTWSHCTCCRGCLKCFSWVAKSITQVAVAQAACLVGFCCCPFRNDEDCEVPMFVLMILLLMLFLATFYLGITFLIVWVLIGGLAESGHWHDDVTLSVKTAAVGFLLILFLLSLKALTDGDVYERNGVEDTADTGGGGGNGGGGEDCSCECIDSCEACDCDCGDCGQVGCDC